MLKEQIYSMFLDYLCLCPAIQWYCNSQVPAVHTPGLGVESQQCSTFVLIVCSHVQCVFPISESGEGGQSLNTHNKLDSAFIHKNENILIFDTIVWVLLKKTKTNIFLLTKCKIQSKPNFGRPRLDMESFLNALFRWQKRRLENY